MDMHKIPLVFLPSAGRRLMFFSTKQTNLAELQNITINFSRKPQDLCGLFETWVLFIVGRNRNILRRKTLLGNLDDVLSYASKFNYQFMQKSCVLVLSGMSKKHGGTFVVNFYKLWLGLRLPALSYEAQACCCSCCCCCAAIQQNFDHTTCLHVFLPWFIAINADGYMG